MRIKLSLNLIRNYCKNGSSQGITQEKQNSSRSRRIFSGIQPTGQIHLGNYFGAIQQWVKLQNEKTPTEEKFQNTIFSIVDLHAITMPLKKDYLQNSIFETTAALLACGIDPEKSILFLQSHVSFHCQLSWVLGCISTMPRLGQLPQFKEKSKTLKDVPLGLYTYPVLQAADIYLYNATHIPIGDDNVEQIKYAIHIGKAFNRIYGDTFNIPKFIVIGDELTNRVRSLKKPENKMSKSDPDSKSRIHLIDSPEEIKEKIKKAITDFTSEVTYDPVNRPGVSNLVHLHSLSTGKSHEELCNEAKNMNTGEYKIKVGEDIAQFLSPIRNKLLTNLNDHSYLLDVLHFGSNKAREIAEPMWENICEKVGISPKKKILSAVGDYSKAEKSS